MSLKAHLRARGHELVTPDEALIRFWWGRLNSALFGGLLRRPRRVTLFGGRSTFAELIPRMPQGTYDLRFNRTQVSRRFFLCILAHEMIHAWDWMEGRTSGHGKRFMRWAPDFERRAGLGLAPHYKWEDSQC